jgi:hypothetical protein
LRLKASIARSDRSSHGQFVKASGLRWLSLMMLVNIPWAGRVWALPFLTVLAPSERSDRKRGHRHKCLTDWARQILKQVRRWLPHRQLVVVADSSFAALELLFSLSQMKSPLHIVTRWRSSCCTLSTNPTASTQANGPSP